MSLNVLIYKHGSYLKKNQCIELLPELNSILHKSQLFSSSSACLLLLACFPPSKCDLAWEAEVNDKLQITHRGANRGLVVMVADLDVDVANSGFDVDDWDNDDNWFASFDEAGVGIASVLAGWRLQVGVMSDGRFEDIASDWMKGLFRFQWNETAIFVSSTTLYFL